MFEENKSRFISGGSGILIYFIGFYIMTIIVEIFGKGNNSFIIVVNLLGFISILGIEYLIHKETIKRNLKYFFGIKRDYCTNWMLRGFLIVVPLMWISNIITHLIGGGISSNQTNLSNSVYFNPVLMVLLSVIIIPIVEELVFRLGIFKLIPSKPLAAIVSVSVFSLLHVFRGGDYINILPYVTMGILFTLVYYKTENIFASIFTHIIWNFLSMINLFLTYFHILKK